MFFTSIEIENFRSIESLKIDNIKQVNLITGRNNCGKTSILEAIFLLVGISNPQLSVNIHMFRDLLLMRDEDFSYLFKNLDFANNPTIIGKLNTQERLLTINPIHPDFSEIPKQISEKRELSNSEFVSNVSTATIDKIEGLNLSFTIDKKKNFQTQIRLRQEQMQLPNGYKEKLRAGLINPKTIMKDIDYKLELILVRKELGIIIDALKEIEPNLLNISMGVRGMIYADIGLDKLIPLNLMGDGIRRILAILTAIVANKNSILLIDEIENGLHHKTLSVLWKAVLKTALANNVQLFITTHSYECVQAITQTYQEQQTTFDKNTIGLFRIERDDKGKHRALFYDADILIAGIEKNFEVR